MLQLYKSKGSFRKSECKGIQNFLYHQMFWRIFFKKFIFHTPKTPHPILKQSIKAITSHKTRHIAKHKAKATQNNKQSLKRKSLFTKTQFSHQN